METERIKIQKSQPYNNVMLPCSEMSVFRQTSAQANCHSELDIQKSEHQISK